MIEGGWTLMDGGGGTAVFPLTPGLKIVRALQIASSQTHIDKVHDYDVPSGTWCWSLGATGWKGLPNVGLGAALTLSGPRGAYGLAPEAYAS